MRGCTSITGASHNAAAWKAKPTTDSPKPANHRGWRTNRSSSPGSISWVGGWRRTARIWATFADRERSRRPKRERHGHHRVAPDHQATAQARLRAATVIRSGDVSPIGFER